MLSMKLIQKKIQKIKKNKNSIKIRKQQKPKKNFFDSNENFKGENEKKTLEINYSSDRKFQYIL